MDEARFLGAVSIVAAMMPGILLGAVIVGLLSESLVAGFLALVGLYGLAFALGWMACRNQGR